MQDEHAELAEMGRALGAKDTRVDARATLRFADGEVATLDLEQGTYRVTSAGTLPGGAARPARRWPTCGACWRDGATPA